MIMDKRELEKKLGELKIPEPDEARKETAIKAAMAEFERAGRESEKNIKGSRDEDRPTGKKWFKGGLIMNRPIIATAGVAALAVLITISIVPIYTKKGKVEVDLSRVVTKPEHQVKVYGEDVQAPHRRTDGDEYAASEVKTGGKGGRIEEGLKQVQPVPAEGRVALKDELRSNEVTGMVSKGEMKKMEADHFSRQAAAPLVESEEISRSKPAALVKEKRRGELPAEGVGGVAVSSPAVSRMVAEPSQIPIDQREYAGRDRFEHKEINPVKVVAEEPVSTFSIDVDTASYAFVRRAINNGHLPQKDAVRVEELINYFDYNYKVASNRSKPFRPTVALYETPWNEETKLLHIGIKGHDIVSGKRPRANLVFLIDVSGSMAMPDKLPLLINSFKLLVGELGPEDTVAIAVYAGAAGTVLEPTKIREKGKVLAALERLRAGGSTAGGAGIQLAYSLAEANFDRNAVNRVILATDGDFNVGIRNPEELKGFVERKRETGVFLSVLGFGQGNYNDALMQALAQNGNGNAAYIDSLSEARKVLVDEASSTLFTIARDVKIQVEFNPAKVAEYRLIGYETRMLKREEFNNDKVDAGDVGAGHSVTAIYEITPVGSGARTVEDLRYKKESVSVKESRSDEYAFLKIRYKLPGEEESRLISQPIDSKSEYGRIGQVPEDIRFAASVAAFGEILKGGKYTKTFDFGDVIALAEPARGRDRFGYRSEFVNLVRLAATTSAMGNR